MHWLQQQAPYHRDACNWWNWCVVCGCSVNDALVVIGFVVVAVLIKTVVVVGACVAILGVDVVDFDAFACVGVVAMAYDAADFVATIVLLAVDAVLAAAARDCVAADVHAGVVDNVEHVVAVGVANVATYVVVVVDVDKRSAVATAAVAAANAFDYSPCHVRVHQFADALRVIVVWAVYVVRYASWQTVVGY